MSTELHAFDTSSSTKTEYVGSGSVPGFVLGRWALSQHEGALRVATTRQPPWDGEQTGKTSSMVVKLEERNGSLVETGRVGGLGKTEQIRAVRYFGDIAAVVTFRQTDPLYLLDLSGQPKVLGELKVPGFSTYLHPIGDGLLLGIGQDADKTGMVTGMQASVFDISDLSRPALVDRLRLGNGYTPALDDSRAFTYDPDRRLATFAFSAYDLSPTSKGEEISSALGITVDEDGQLHEAGRMPIQSGGLVGPRARRRRQPVRRGRGRCGRRQRRHDAEHRLGAVLAQVSGAGRPPAARARRSAPTSRRRRCRRGPCPPRPSIVSRMMSACPACCAVSATQRTRSDPRVVDRRSSGHHATVAGASSPSSAIDSSECCHAVRYSATRSSLVSSAVAHMSALSQIDSSSTHGSRTGDGPAHRVTQVAELDAGQVLDEPQQVGGGRRDRPAHVVLAQPVQRGEHALPRLLQVAVQVVGNAAHQGWRPRLASSLSCSDASAGTGTGGPQTPLLWRLSPRLSTNSAT